MRFPEEDTLQEDFCSPVFQQLRFRSIESGRPLCSLCESMTIQQLVSTQGLSSHQQGRLLQTQAESPTGCPICRFFWKALSEDLKTKRQKYGFLKITFSDLENHPVKLFLNPYAAHQKPYQLREFSIWSASSHELSYIEYREYYSSVDEPYYNRLDTGVRLLAKRHPEPARRIKKFISATFKVETSLNDSLSEIVAVRSVLEDPCSSEALELIRQWLRTCIDTHENCSRIASRVRRLPLRLIDVGPEDGSQAPFLHTVGESLPDDDGRGTEMKYVALSYCWGTGEELARNPPLTTTPSNIEAHKRGIVMAHLPRTIQDVIVLTRRLGIRYLWVDSLCIMQGNDATARADWERESSMMAEVYGGATLTIAAASGRSVHDPLFPPRRQHAREHLAIGLESEDKKLKGTIFLHKSSQDFVDSVDEPLYHRGWVLQERVLSPRVLICNRDQLAWECNCQSMTESGHQMESIGAMRLDAEILGKAESLRGVLYDTWQCLITEYSARSLSIAMDKLPAIAGLAKKFHEHHGDTYLAGCWKQSILDDLLWAHAKIRHGPSHPRTKPTEYRAPSWSWASVDGNVRWPLAPHNRKAEYCAQFLDYHLDTKPDNNPFGLVTGGWITVRGPLARAEPKDFPKWAMNGLTDANFDAGSELADWQEKERLSVYCSMAAEYVCTHEIFILVLLARGAGLILALHQDHSVVTLDGAENVYRRIGMTSSNFAVETDPRFTVQTCRIV